MTDIALTFHDHGPVELLRRDEAGNHRTTLVPGDDLAGLAGDERAQIEAHWTAACRAAWRETLAAAQAAEPAEPPGAAAIKAEAARRILDALPEWKQRNLIAEAVALLSAGAGGGARAGEIDAFWQWVRQVRLASDDLERTLPEDYRDDSHWPAAPA